MRLRRLGILGMNRRNVGYIGRYNPRSRFPLVDDKLKTKLIATDAGVTVPALLRVIETQHDVRDVAKVLVDLEGFAIKPSRGSGGKGILVVAGRDGETFVKTSGDRVNLEGIQRHLSNILSGLYSLGGRPDVAILESLVVVDPIFSEVSYEGVPDIRLIVFQGYPVMGMLRLATRASDGKANLHQGAVGVGLDIATGKAIAAVQFDRPIDRHPDTGAALDDIAVPTWNQLVTLAARCFEVTGLGYLGTDIVLDKDRGPMVLEFNARPGLTIQVANERGLRPRLSAVEELVESGRTHRTAEERVAWAMEHMAHAVTAPRLH
jgi:alpha-L-glutamate ligase-like protein